MKKILLVDDQKSVLTSLSILLRRNGFHVTTAKNRADAKTCLVREDFNLVLTDLRMEKPYDGLTVLKDAITLRSGIRVIVMTAFGTIENAVDAMSMGAVNYITKGFSNSELIQKINTALIHNSFTAIENVASKKFDKIVGKSKPMQAKLLRVLQEKTVLPVGSTATYPVDVRIICATNKDLQEAVSSGSFREDLYFRLCVIPVFLPCLEERKEDIPLLVEFFIHNFAKKFSKIPVKMGKNAMELISNHHWQGNIRELENFIERLVLLFDGPVCARQDIAALLPPDKKPGAASDLASLSGSEKGHIRTVLDQCDGNQSRAAKKLGIGRTTLWRKIKRYEIRTPD